MKGILNVGLFILALSFFHAHGQIARNSVIEKTSKNPVGKIGRLDTVLHTQKLQREDVKFWQYFKGCYGILTLTDNEVIFLSVKPKNSVINFRLSYSEIVAIRPVNILFLPNRIKIIGKNNEKYNLFTYKRSKIIELVRQRIRS